MIRRERLRLPLLLLLVFALAGSLASQTPSSPLTPWLETALRQGRAEQRHAVWVYFRDKGPESARSLPASSTTVSARARARRARRATVTSTTLSEDLPVAPTYVAEVTARVSRLRHQSRWLNAVSVEATASQVQDVAALPFVSRIDIVRRYRRAHAEPLTVWEAPPAERDDRAVSRSRESKVDYGSSIDQLSQIGVPELHKRGLTGEGVVVAIFDSGFPNLEHEAFGRLTILAERDFVNGIDSVRGSIHPHGTATLSVLGGFEDGQLIGPVYGATFMLAVTEDGFSETPVEEDNWTAAAEWAESMGADVISSSLGTSISTFRLRAIPIATWTATRRSRPRPRRWRRLAVSSW